MTLYRTTAEQIATTYAHMAHLGYRPAAPSDGFGNITVPLDQLDLGAESMKYARSWDTEEDEQSWYVGCPPFEGRPALILAIEAARLICGCSPDIAARLLRFAADDLERNLT